MSKLSKKERLEAKKEKQAEARAAREKGATETKNDPKDLKDKLKGLEAELTKVYDEIDQIIRVNTVGGDVAWTGGHFCGHNSQFLNGKIAPKIKRREELKSKIGHMKDLIDPSRVTTRKNIEEERKRIIEMCKIEEAAREERRRLERLVEEDERIRQAVEERRIADEIRAAEERRVAEEEKKKYLIQRVVIGPVVPRVNGVLSGVKCYHQKPDGSYIDCDCTRGIGKDRNNFTLSNASQLLQDTGKLEVNNSKWEERERIADTLSE
jgi:hypothetical protein